MKQLLPIAALLLAAQAGFAQSTSGIAIEVYDSTGESLVNWPVIIYQNDKEIMTVYTDDDGEALAKPLSPNVYRIQAKLGGTVRSIPAIPVGISEVPAITVDPRQPASCNCFWMRPHIAC